MMSKDAVAVATLLGSLAMAKLMGGNLIGEVEDFFTLCFSYAAMGGTAVVADFGKGLLIRYVLAFVIAVGPFLAATALLAVAATFAQTRMLVTGEALKPKFSRINPLEGFKRLFSLRSVIEALKGILKITVLLVLIFNYFRKVVITFSRFLDMELSQACAILFEDAFALVTQIAVAFVVLAFFDYLYQWWDYERQLRMSKQEIKEEYKQLEGDPQVKGKIKEIQRRRAQQRMMQQVPGADVVIRNPTHVAVALRYDEHRDNAPVVLAKGLDELALRIVKVAEQSGVAVVENVPLARSLYAEVDLEREIPPAFYGAVAEVLVYVMQLEKKLPKA